MSKNNELLTSHVMNKTQQRIKIAEICGWTEIYQATSHQYKTTNHEPWLGWNPRKSECTFIPDYFNDLNAMHEAEMAVIVARGLTKTFNNHLYNIINRGPNAATGLDYDDLVTGEEVAALRIHATAAHRAEAFLKTLNL